MVNSQAMKANWGSIVSALSLIFAFAVQLPDTGLAARGGSQDAGGRPGPDIVAIGGGSQDAGGGDPEAVEFVKIMKQLPALVRLLRPLHAVVTAEQFEKLAGEFDQSLNDKDITNDRVVFTNDPILLHGVEKAAVYDGKRAIVSRQVWLAYKSAGVQQRMRAIVLLEGLLALGIQTDRYQAAEGLLAFSHKDVELHTYMMLQSSGESARLYNCDTIAKKKVGKDQGTELIEFVSMFEFSWHIGDRSYGMKYLARAEGAAKGLPVMSLSMMKTTYPSYPKRDEMISQRVATEIFADSRNVQIFNTDASYYRKDRPDGSLDMWVWKDGKRGEHLGHLNSKKVAPEMRGNQMLEVRETDDEEWTSTSTCTDTPIGNEWKSTLPYPELVNALGEFDDFGQRVANAEIAFFNCRVETAKDCADLKKIHDSLAKGAELRWAQLIKALKQVYENKIKRQPIAEVRQGGGTRSERHKELLRQIEAKQKESKIDDLKREVEALRRAVERRRR